jgi:predicted transcriptional regulator
MSNTKKVPVTLTLDQELNAALMAVRAREQRSRAWLINEAVRQYVERDQARRADDETNRR